MRKNNSVLATLLTHSIYMQLSDTEKRVYWISFSWSNDKNIIIYIHSDIQSNLDCSNIDGSFTMANSNSFLGPYEILPIVQEYKNLRKFSYYIMKSSQRFQWVHSTYNYCVENRKDCPKDRCLRPDLVPLLNLSGSNYPYLEQIFMVPKMFEPLKFDCTLIL